jgi:hypothetical protein
MTTKDTGGPAFPFVYEESDEMLTHTGMTLRDYFAAKALAAFGAAYINSGWSSPNIVQLERVVASAYITADLMLAERNERLDNLTTFEKEAQIAEWERLKGDK